MSVPVMVSKHCQYFEFHYPQLNLSHHDTHNFNHLVQVMLMYVFDTSKLCLKARSTSSLIAEYLKRAPCG